jgi:adenylate kinase
MTISKNQKYKAILIFGPPGAGKGTQAKLISDNKKYFHFSTGDMFRSMDRESETGKKIHELISGGNFVPDELTVKLFFDTIERYAKEKKFNPKKQMLLLDGIPRNPNQVGLIADKIDVVRVINLSISNYEEIVKRLAKRAVLEGRKDDNEETIKKRLSIYDKETHAILGKYPKELILDINGIGSVEEVYGEIAKRLEQ